MDSDSDCHISKPKGRRARAAADVQEGSAARTCTRIARRMGGANGSRECAPDDKLRYTHQLHFAEVMGSRRLNPSSGLTTRPAQVICPSGCLSTGVSSLISDFPKNISVPTYPKSHLELSSSHPTRGAYRDRHGRGVGCGGRGSVGARWGRRAGLKACERHLSEQTNGADAYGKIVWS